MFLPVDADFHIAVIKEFSACEACGNRLPSATRFSIPIAPAAR
jgi:hypothetical protein